MPIVDILEGSEIFKGTLQNRLSAINRALNELDRLQKNEAALRGEAAQLEALLGADKARANQPAKKINPKRAVSSVEETVELRSALDEIENILADIPEGLEPPDILIRLNEKTRGRFNKLTPTSIDMTLKRHPELFFKKKHRREWIHIKFFDEKPPPEREKK